MIAAFSTSSPWASVAIFGSNGEVLWHGEREAAHQSGGACLEMLASARRELGFSLTDLQGFAADVGPGSFTGVRVGVMLAKTLAFLYGKPVVGADSFDLIDPVAVVVLPSKRGEFFVRRPGEPPFRSGDLPAGVYRGFGPGVEPSVTPDAARFGPLLAGLVPQSPLEFVPHYLIEPSISVPKRPYAAPGGSAD